MRLAYPIMTHYKDKSDHPEAYQLNQQAYVEGCGHYDLEDLPQAMESFQVALEYCPEDPRAWFALGNCHDGTRQASKAEVCYLMSLKFSEPGAKPNVYYNLGNSLFDQGKYSEAVECYGAIDAQSKVYDAAQKNLALAKARLT